MTNFEAIPKDISLWVVLINWLSLNAKKLKLFLSYSTLDNICISCFLIPILMEERKRMIWKYFQIHGEKQSIWQLGVYKSWHILRYSMHSTYWGGAIAFECRIDRSTGPIIKEMSFVNYKIIIEESPSRIREKHPLKIGQRPC